MRALNELKAIVSSYRVTSESQSYWAAAVAPTTTPTLKSRTRRIKYTTTRYEGGNYISARAKADELEANPAITDIDLQENEPGQYIVMATLKSEGAWSAWS